MRFFHKIKEGGYINTGFNIMSNDPNAYINIKCKFPLFLKQGKDRYFDWVHDVWYYGVTLMPMWCLYVRVRKWGYVSSPYSIYKTFLSKVAGMFILRSRTELKIVKYTMSQTEEMEDLMMP